MVKRTAYSNNNQVTEMKKLEEEPEYEQEELKEQPNDKKSGESNEVTRILMWVGVGILVILFILYMMYLRRKLADLKVTQPILTAPVSVLETAPVSDLDIGTIFGRFK